MKEEQIETKLASIQADWATINLVFADCKTRGPVILKASDTAELIEKLEDSQVRACQNFAQAVACSHALLSVHTREEVTGRRVLPVCKSCVALSASGHQWLIDHYWPWRCVCCAQMALGSMATNRYSAPFREDVQAWIVKLSTVGEIIEQVRARPSCLAMYGWGVPRAPLACVPIVLAVHVQQAVGAGNDPLAGNQHQVMGPLVLACSEYSGGSRCASPSAYDMHARKLNLEFGASSSFAVANGAEHVDVHGGCVLRRRHCEAAAAGGQALPEHRQELHEDRDQRAGDPERCQHVSAKAAWLQKQTTYAAAGRGGFLCHFAQLSLSASFCNV